MSFTLGTASYFLKRQINQEIDFQAYCEKYELQNMITECTKFYVRKASVQPNNAFNEFVQSYFKGESTVLRSFQQISNSKMNKLIFIINFSKIFENFEEKTEYDYQQLTKLLCSDFPRELLMNSLSLHSQLDDEQLYKKTQTMQQFCKSLLFEMLFDNILNEIHQKLNQQNSLENLIPILKKYYITNEENLFLPNPAAVFEVLIKFSNEKNQQCQFPILPFTVDMFSNQYLNGGMIEFQNFKMALFKNNKIDFQLSKLLNTIDKANLRIQEANKLEDDDNKKKKQK